MTMPFDFDPDQQTVVLVTGNVLLEAQHLIAFCEQCNADEAEYTFDLLLDHVTGCDPTVTEYLLEMPAQCPQCKRDVFEKTLVATHSP